MPLCPGGQSISTPVSRLPPELRQAPLPHPASRKSAERFVVTILDNDTNTYEQVIRICMQALGISYEEGLEIALAVDNNGRAAVFEGTKEDAEAVAAVIRTIGIEVLVEPA